MSPESFDLEAESAPEPSRESPVTEAEIRNGQLVHRLSVAAWALGAVILIVIAYSVFSIISRGDAPRTAAERQILLSEQATKENASSFTAWSQLARAYIAGGEYSAAHEAVRKAKKLQPDNVAVFLLSGDIALAQEDYEAALKQYKDGLKLAETPTAATKKAAAEASVKLPEPYYQEDANTIAYAAAEAYIALKDWDSAIDMLLLATKYNPRDATSWTLLGDAYAESGDEANARDAYEEALRFIPDYQPALLGIQELDQ